LPTSELEPFILKLVVALPSPERAVVSYESRHVRLSSAAIDE
jgi:hypothetical protein